MNPIALWRCRKSGSTPFYRLHCNAFVPLRRSAPPWTRWCRCCKLTHCQAAPAISAIFTTPPSPTTKGADGSSQKIKTYLLPCISSTTTKIYWQLHSSLPLEEPRESLVMTAICNMKSKSGFPVRGASIESLS